MDFAFSPEQDQFRAEVRAFCASSDPLLDDPTKSRGLKGGYSSAFYRELGRRGWLGLQIPVEYGGAGQPPIDEAILAEELGWSPDRPPPGPPAPDRRCRDRNRRRAGPRP